MSFAREWRSSLGLGLVEDGAQCGVTPRELPHLALVRLVVALAKVELEHGKERAM